MHVSPELEGGHERRIAKSLGKGKFQEKGKLRRTKKGETIYYSVRETETVFFHDRKEKLPKLEGGIKIYTFVPPGSADPVQLVQLRPDQILGEVTLFN